MYIDRMAINRVTESAVMLEQSHHIHHDIAGLLLAQGAYELPARMKVV